MKASHYETLSRAQARCFRMTGWEKDEALAHLLSLFRQSFSELIEAAEKDKAAAMRARLSQSVLARLAPGADDLERWQDLLERTMKRADPGGQWLQTTDLEFGQRLARKTIPCGPLRAGVFQDPERLWRVLLASLRSGNALLLVPGQEMLHLSLALQRLLEQWQQSLDLQDPWVSLLPPRDSKQEEALMAEPGYGATLLVGPPAVTERLARLVSGPCLVHVERKETLWMLRPPDEETEAVVRTRSLPCREGATNLLLPESLVSAWRNPLEDLPATLVFLSLDEAPTHAAWHNPDVCAVVTVPDNPDEALDGVNRLPLSVVGVWTNQYDHAQGLSSALHAPCVLVNGLFSDLLRQLDKDRLVWGIGNQPPLAYGLLTEHALVATRTVLLDRKLAH